MLSKDVCNSHTTLSYNREHPTLNGAFYDFVWITCIILHCRGPTVWTIPIAASSLFKKLKKMSSLIIFPTNGATVGRSITSVCGRVWSVTYFLRVGGKGAPSCWETPNHRQSHQQLSWWISHSPSVPAYPALFCLLIFLILYLAIVLVLLLEGPCLVLLKLHKTGHSSLWIVEHGSPGHSPPVLPCPVPSASQIKKKSSGMPTCLGRCLLSYSLPKCFRIFHDISGSCSLCSSKLLFS